MGSVTLAKGDEINLTPFITCCSSCSQLLGAKLPDGHKLPNRQCDIQQNVNGVTVFLFVKLVCASNRVATNRTRTPGWSSLI